MTKDQLKQYINEAVDAMGEDELNYLFPPNHQPDLYTLAEAFTSLKGEVKKLAQSNLKGSNEMQSAMAINNDRWLHLQQLLTADPDPEPEKELDDDLKNILFQLIDQNDLLTDTHQHLQSLDQPHWKRLNRYKKQFSTWQKGYDITMTRWQKFMKSTGLYKTGMPGTTFDPQIHEVVAVEHHTDQPNNQILETELVGYLFRNRIVRQAKVVVNKTDPEETIEKIRKPIRHRKKSKKKKQKRKAKRK